jgi:hypothetical protein
MSYPLFDLDDVPMHYREDCARLNLMIVRAHELAELLGEVRTRVEATGTGGKELERLSRQVIGQIDESDRLREAIMERIARDLGAQ